MKFCISFGKFELKYFFYCVLIVILELYLSYFIWDEEMTIITNHILMYSFCFFLGYLLNIIPAWISHILSNEKEKVIEKKLEKENAYSFEYIYNNPNEKYLSAKEILKFLFICLILLLADIIENIGTIIENIKKYKKCKYCFDKKLFSDDYFFIEYLIIFLVLKLDKEVYYKHQYISFFVLILIELIKNIYFFIIYKNYNIISIVLNIIYSIFYAIYYLYIKGLMKYKFISPYKCNYMIGIINVPIIILMYFIISFTPLGNDNKDNEYYYDNIFEFFKDIRNIDAIIAIKLISLPLVIGMFALLYIKIIYDYSIFHMYIPFLIQYLIENITKDLNLFEIIFLISSFFVELIMILVFLEIVEINYCGLNKNLKRNIQSRGKIDSFLAIENDDDDDEIEDEINDEKTKL